MCVGTTDKVVTKHILKRAADYIFSANYFCKLVLWLIFESFENQFYYFENQTKMNYRANLKNKTASWDKHLVFFKS